MSEVVQHFPGPDGRERVTVHKRADGLFEFTFERFHIDDLPEFNHHMEYWAIVERQGIFDSPATARNEAAGRYPWVATNGR